MTMGQIITRRALLRAGIGAVALGLAGLRSSGTEAGKGWCRSDPLIHVNGQMVRLLVVIPAEVEPLVNADTVFSVQPHTGDVIALRATTPGFNGYGQQLRILRVGKHLRFQVVVRTRSKVKHPVRFSVVLAGPRAVRAHEVKGVTSSPVTVVNYGLGQPQIREPDAAIGQQSGPLRISADDLPATPSPQYGAPELQGRTVGQRGGIERIIGGGVEVPRADQRVVEQRIDGRDPHLHRRGRRAFNGHDRGRARGRIVVASRVRERGGPGDGSVISLATPRRR